MTVEGVKGCLQLRRQVERVERLCLAPAFFRHPGPDMFPEVAEHRHFLARDIVGHRDTGQLDDAALDGIHQGEVAHGPGEERSLNVA